MSGSFFVDMITFKGLVLLCNRTLKWSLLKLFKLFAFIEDLANNHFVLVFLWTLEICLLEQILVYYLIGWLLIDFANRVRAAIMLGMILIYTNFILCKLLGLMVFVNLSKNLLIRRWDQINQALQVKSLVL